jgi:hypothetical protein
MRLITQLSRRVRLSAEGGFTMILVLGALALTMLLSIAAFAAINSDLPLTSNDSHQKQAYAAAQAGIQQYLFLLDQNSEYWTQCVPSSNPGAINQAGSTANTRPVPGQPGETYAIELMPANGFTSCLTSNPVNSMIQTSGNGAGTLRIRSTGFAGNVKRTVVANLREQSFLDYVWFTNYETSDPYVQVATAFASNGDVTLEPPSDCGSSPPKGCGSKYSTALNGATAQCGQFRYGPPTGAASSKGYNRYTNNTAGTGTNGAFYKSSSTATPANTTYSCDAINFITADSVKGPFHSNDEPQLCGSPTFGRTSADNIEFGTGSSPGYYQSCTGNPNMVGTPNFKATILTPPPSNQSLASLATGSYSLTGTTCIQLTSTGINVAQPGVGANSAKPSCFSSGLTYTTLTYPTNGVMYIANGACSVQYDVENPSYTGNTGCGTVYVSGVDAQPLTIAAENDIVITGSLTYPSPNTNNSLLGLIANNFIRVYHPVGSQPLTNNSSPCTSGSSNASGALSSPSINAMLLSLQHSFIVDQYNCGAALGTLTVNGGIAQNFRGPVGTNSGGSVVTGYAKNYNYDDRLRYIEPPHFIDPVQGSWRVIRANECTPRAATSLLPAVPC